MNNSLDLARSLDLTREKILNRSQSVNDFWLENRSLLEELGRSGS